MHSNPGSHNQAVTEQLNSMMRRHRSSLRNANRGPMAVGPGGRVVDAEPYLRNVHKQEEHCSQMGDVDLHPERYLKNHQPGYRYLWISLKDTFAKGRVQSGRYQEVLEEDLLSENALAYSTDKLLKPQTHKGNGRAVIQYDLQLVKCSPENWEALFGIRESMGMAKVSSGVEKFYDQIEAEGASASFEMTPVHGE